jgi:hypothetical protein
MDSNERSIEQWEEMHHQERVAWLRKYVWGGTKSECGGTDGALSEGCRLNTKIGYTCKVCTKKWEWSKGGTTVRKVARHINTERHKQNYWLFKLGGN